MNDIFEKRVRAAAVAGWWVVVIAVAFLTLLWLVYLAVMSVTREGDGQNYTGSGLLPR